MKLAPFLIRPALGIALRQQRQTLNAVWQAFTTQLGFYQSCRLGNSFIVAQHFQSIKV
jgi:hypothetical protein